MAVVDELQRSLEALHDVDTGLEVSVYLVSDEVRRTIPGAREGLPEQLFVREAEDGVDVALYIAPTIVESLERDPPSTRLHPGNFEPYCIALEGVSHFVLLAHRASYDRPVSALELEIQAEVDKFVTAWLTLVQQGAPSEATSHALVRQLFESYEVREELSADEAEVYHVASRVAGAFCRRLSRKHARDPRGLAMRKEVRAFYRGELAEKVRVA